MANNNQNKPPLNPNDQEDVGPPSFKSLVEKYTMQDRFANDVAYRQWMESKHRERHVPLVRRDQPEIEVPPSTSPDEFAKVKRQQQQQRKGDGSATVTADPIGSTVVVETETERQERLRKNEEAVRAWKEKKRAEALNRKERLRTAQQQKQQLQAQKLEQQRIKEQRTQEQFQRWQQQKDDERRREHERKAQKEAERQRRHQQKQHQSKEAFQRWLQAHPADQPPQRSPRYPHQQPWQIVEPCDPVDFLADLKPKSPQESTQTLQSPPHLFNDQKRYQQMASSRYLRKYRLLIASGSN
jgi:hypothetical protein